jgi:hypothetical protein
VGLVGDEGETGDDEEELGLGLEYTGLLEEAGGEVVDGGEHHFSVLEDSGSKTLSAETKTPTHIRNEAQIMTNMTCNAVLTLPIAATPPMMMMMMSREGGENSTTATKIPGTLETSLYSHSTLEQKRKSFSNNSSRSSTGEILEQQRRHYDLSVR